MDVFAALAEPHRRLLLEMLVGGARPAGDLVEALPALTQPAVSRHLRILREAGLVDVRPDAQRRLYALKRDGFEPLEQWLAGYQRYWTSHLDALERHLDATPTSETSPTPTEEAPNDRH